MSVTVQDDVVTVVIQEAGSTPITVNEANSSTSVTQAPAESTSIEQNDTDVAIYEGVPISGGGDKNYTQSFTASTTVTVNHNLGKKPSVTVKDSAGSEVEGDVDYVTNNQLTVTFSSAFTGTIILN